jgi:hypothetical protein
VPGIQQGLLISKRGLDTVRCGHNEV